MTPDGVLVGLEAFALAGAGIVAGLYLSRRSAWAPAGGLALVAAAPLAPHAAISMGLSLDDILAILGVAFLLAALRPWERRWVAPAVLQDRRIRLVVVALGAGMALLVLAAAASCVVNAPDLIQCSRMFLRSGGRYAFLGLIAVLTAMSVPAALRVAVVTRAVAALGTFEAAYGLVAFVLPLPYHMGLEGFAKPTVLSGHVPGRIAGTLGISPDFLGAIFVFTIPLTVALALEAPERQRRVLWAVSAGAQTLALGLTFTRSSLAIVAAEILILMLLRGRLRYLAGLAATLVPVALFTPAIERLAADMPDRLALWTSGIRLMLDHPLFGVGSGMTVNALRADPAQYAQTPFGFATNTPHNTILLAGAELGIVGFLGALLVNVALAALAFRIVWLCRNSQWSLAGAAGGLSILGFLAQGMVNDLFTVAVVGTTAALVIGACALEVVAQDDIRSARFPWAGVPAEQAPGS